MILSFVVLLLIALSGLVLTYWYEEEDTLLARLAAGIVIGSAIFATVGFLLACFFGLSTLTVLGALLLTALPLLLLRKKAYKMRFRRDWLRARDRLQGASARKLWRFAYYAGLFALLWLFFERAMIETRDGIYTGVSHNLGDLPFHLGAIYSFAEGNNFPPENPSFAFAKFTYPFLADFITACLYKLGVSVRDAMLVHNILLGFSLVVLLEKFTVRLVGSRLAGKFAPLLLLLSGGLGFIWFFRDYWQGTAPFFEFLSSLPRDYTIGDLGPDGKENYRWGNSLLVLFITQRSLLFGLPLTLIALMKIWDIFRGAPRTLHEEKAGGTEQVAARTKNAAGSLRDFFRSSPFLVGLLAGMLPLIHVHSLAVLFVVCAFLFFFNTEEKWRQWIAFAAGVSLVAVPELAWSLTGSASDLSKFIGWHFGWDARGENFFVFWAENTGLFIPLLLIGLYLIFKAGRAPAASETEKPKSKAKMPKTKGDRPDARHLLLFYLPFAFLFLVSNTVKLAPWEWDNIKVLIYWFVGSLPFVAFVLAWLWEKGGSGGKGKAVRAAVVGAFIILTFAGALDVWRTISKQVNQKVFSSEAIEIAETIRLRTPRNALFLNAPTYNSAIVLAGRRSLMRYGGHLSSYGIDFGPRETEVRQIYQGAPSAVQLLEKNGIEYVIISPEEHANVSVNEEFFRNSGKFQLMAEAGPYRVYKVK